jgi:hypothetical protein
MYRPGVRYDLIALAARELPCPVLANGNVYDAGQALRLVQETGVRGLMIGRGAIRNPWLFQQIRQGRNGLAVRLPTGRDVLAYIGRLWESQITEEVPERSQVQRMKKFMNFIGEGICAPFLFEIRRVETRPDFFGICKTYLDHTHPMPLHPLPDPEHDGAERAVQSAGAADIAVVRCAGTAQDQTPREPACPPPLGLSTARTLAFEAR